MTRYEKLVEIYGEDSAKVQKKVTCPDIIGFAKEPDVELCKNIAHGGCDKCWNEEFDEEAYKAHIERNSGSGCANGCCEIKFDNENKEKE